MAEWLDPHNLEGDEQTTQDLLMN